MLPLVITLPFGPVPEQPVFTPQIALFQKANTEVMELLSTNQAVNPETKVLQARAAAIDAYFEARNAPLAGFGETFVRESVANDLDWRLAPAIAMIETSGGKNLCKRLPADRKWNPFGWGSCKIGFSSFGEAIETVTRNLGGNNPNTAHHYEDKDNREILEKYNPPSIVPDYADKVLKVMNTIGPVDLGIGESLKEV